jgi:hypothetical protein
MKTRIRSCCFVPFSFKGFEFLYRERGLSYRGIAEKLNSNGHASRRGKRFYASSVERLVKRAELIDTVKRVA